MWVGLHLHERAGVTAVVGLEVFSEAPADARQSLGPSSGALAADLAPVAPVALRALDVAGVSLEAILDRFRVSSDEAGAMAGVPGAKGARYSDDHWRRVANHYLRFVSAYGGTRGVVDSVAGQWSISRATAKAWIGRARAEGFLDQVSISSASG